MKKILLFLWIVPFTLSAQNFWTEVAPFTDSEFYAKEISVVDESTIWVWGVQSSGSEYSHRYSISLDGGETWTDGIINSNLSVTVTSIHAVSATTAYVTVAATEPSAVSALWKTTDSGQTWMPLTLNSLSAFPNFVHFFDPNNGVVVCDSTNDHFQIYTTADAGANWTLVPETSVPQSWLNEYGYSNQYKFQNNTLWFSTNKGRIYKSTDMGLSWSVNSTPIFDFGDAEEGASFDFKSGTEGLLISKDFDYYRTTDAGNNWVQEFPTTPFRNFETIFVNGTANTYFSIGETDPNFTESGIERGSSYSIDGGENWIDLNEVDADPVMPMTAKFASGTIGFCIGHYLSEPSGSPLRFFKLTDPLNRFLKNENFINVQFSTIPNPTNGMVKISGTAINAVELYDVFGKTVTTQNYTAVSEANLDITALQSGIYFARITTQSGAFSTVKILKN